MIDTKEKMYSMRETAALLGVPVDRLKSWVRYGKAHPTKVSDSLRAEGLFAESEITRLKTFLRGGYWREPAPEGLMCQATAARQLGVSRQRVTELVHEKKLKVIRIIGRKRYVRCEDVEKLRG